MKLTILLLAITLTSSCASIQAWRSNATPAEKLVAAKIDANTWAGAACKNAPPSEQAKLRGAIPLLAAQAKAGNMAAVRTAMLDRTSGAVPQTLWWAISAAMTGFGSQGSWLASLDDVLSTAILACDEALGIGTA